MIIVTNPGSNLTAGELLEHDIRLTPQQIVVDGQAHDTRAGISFEDIDRWVTTAREHPHVVGTTASEFVQYFQRLAQEDHEILAVMTSRKIIGSHDAAVVAANTLRTHPRFAHVRIVVADSGVTDGATGMACILAAKARRAGKSLDEVARMLEAFRAAIRLAFTVGTLDYLVKGGRATAVRAFLANIMGIRPLLALTDGEFIVAEKVSQRVDPTTAVAAYLARLVGTQRAVHAMVFHGNAPDLGARLAVELQRQFRCVEVTSRGLAPSIYLHAGPGAVGACVIPTDAL